MFFSFSYVGRKTFNFLIFIRHFVYVRKTFFRDLNMPFSISHWAMQVFQNTESDHSESETCLQGFKYAILKSNSPFLTDQSKSSRTQSQLPQYYNETHSKLIKRKCVKNWHNQDGKSKAADVFHFLAETSAKQAPTSSDQEEYNIFSDHQTSKTISSRSLKTGKQQRPRLGKL